MNGRVFLVVHHPVHQPGTEETAPKAMIVTPPRLSIGNRLMIAACLILAAYIIGTAGVAIWKILLQ